MNRQELIELLIINGLTFEEAIEQIDKKEVVKLDIGCIINKDSEEII